MPHGFCFLWNSRLLWLHAVSDALIFAAYLSISFVLIYVARHRADLPHRRMFWCFGTFIVSCGFSHGLDVWTLWRPDYWISGAVKALTAAASAASAAMLIRLLPEAATRPFAPAAGSTAWPAPGGKSKRHLWMAYGVSMSLVSAIVMVLDAGGAESAASAPVIVLVIPILLAAFFGGLVPGLVASVVSVLASIHFILPLGHTWHVARPAENVKWIALLAAGAGISGMSEWLHRARARAQAGEAHLAGIIGSAMDAIIAVDGRWCISLLNPAAERMFGWSAREALGRPIEQFVPGFCLPAGCSQRPSGAREALLAVRAGGEEFPIEVTVSPRVPGEGLPSIVILRDVTERKRAEAENLRLATAIEQAAESVVITDVDAIIQYVNPAFTRMTGYSREEAIGAKASLLRSGAHRREFYAGLWSAILAGQNWHGAIVNRRKDGTLYHEEMTITPVRGERGEITNFIAIKQDVTERLRAEDEIRELNASLEGRVNERTAELASAVAALQGEIAERAQAERALERLNLETAHILNSAGDGIFRLDVNGNCTFANPAGRRLLGYEPQELAGQNLHRLSRHCLPDGKPCEPAACGISIALTQGVRRSSENQIFYRKGGAPVFADTIVTPIVENGVIAGAVEILRDASERRAAERLKQEFVSVVSHELRSPLTSIRGALGLLVAGKARGQPGQAEHLIEIAVRNADRLTRLISDILDSQRMESGALSLVRRHTRASDLVLQATELMQPMAQAAGIGLRAAPQPLPLFVDPDAILQVLSNLLSNAIKFSPGGSTVGTTVRAGHEAVTFEVADEGQGIPADKLESIFERFRPVDASDSRRRGGTGLGLSICRRIVQHHGGRIWARSELGRGSTFVFTLPLDRSEEAATPAENAAGETSDSEAGDGG